MSATWHLKEILKNGVFFQRRVSALDLLLQTKDTQEAPIHGSSDRTLPSGMETMLMDSTKWCNATGNSTYVHGINTDAIIHF